MGIRGNLHEGEILEQLVHVEKILRNERLQSEEDRNGTIYVGSSIRNCVFMGMGEPLNNFKNVVSAVKSMFQRKRWNMRQGRVTVSTVGVTPNMIKLTKEIPDVSLALSLHAPNQEMRSAIVPAAKSYSIEGLIDALDNHLMAKVKDKNDLEARKLASKKRRVMIEYVMRKFFSRYQMNRLAKFSRLTYKILPVDGETSSFECAHELGKLCLNRHLYVNLIPYNPTDVKDTLRCPSEEIMREFQSIVASYNTFCYIRRTMGADVNGACGQLIVKKEKSSSHVDDIEDTTGPRGKPSLRLVSSLSRRNSILQKYSDDERTLQLLMIATGVAAFSFAVSVALFATRRQSGDKAFR